MRTHRNKNLCKTVRTLRNNVALAIREDSALSRKDLCKLQGLLTDILPGGNSDLFKLSLMERLKGYLSFKKDKDE